MSHFWNFEKRPYRPVANTKRAENGRTVDLDPDCFIDRKGRHWYAKGELVGKLPACPDNVEKIPPEFHKPDEWQERRVHLERKQELENRRADLQLV